MLFNKDVYYYYYYYYFYYYYYYYYHYYTTRTAPRLVRSTELSPIRRSSYLDG